MNRGGAGCSSSAVFISLSEETAELVLRWRANGMHKVLIIKRLYRNPHFLQKYFFVTSQNYVIAFGGRQKFNSELWYARDYYLAI